MFFLSFKKRQNWPALWALHTSHTALLPEMQMRCIEMEQSSGSPGNEGSGPMQLGALLMCICVKPDGVSSLCGGLTC